MNKPELLAPAGNPEKLKIAIKYGADAVYCGGFDYGLRAGADNFSLQELNKSTKFVHQRQKKIYITINMIPHNKDLTDLPDYLHELEEIGVDGLIVSDPGVINIINKEKIDIPLHLSTQANTVNYAGVRFWKKQGINRIILARELSKEEIKDINHKSDISLEVFIHGAMCISYSGRCLLSNYMVQRDANQGECAHCCRWQYHLMEEQRPGEYYPVVEDEHGSYILNSKDLCLIEYLPQVVNTGVDSLKIEGRMKGLHYVATVTGVYRKALDTYLSAPDQYQFKGQWLRELKKVSHRDYTTGFFLGTPQKEGHSYQESSYLRTYDFMGVVRSYDVKRGEAIVEVREKFFKGDQVEITGPEIKPFTAKVEYIINEKGDRVNTAPHPHEKIRIPVTKKVKPDYIVRRQREER